MAKLIDCKEGHASIKIRGENDDELVRNAEAHLKQFHPAWTSAGSKSSGWPPPRSPRG